MSVPLILPFVSTVAFAIQFLIFAYLYSSHRVRFFQYLLFAWGAYTVSKGLKLVDVLVLDRVEPSFATAFAGVAAVGLTLAAAFAHRGRRAVLAVARPQGGVSWGAAPGRAPGPLGRASHRDAVRERRAGIGDVHGRARRVHHALLPVDVRGDHHGARAGAQRKSAAARAVARGGAACHGGGAGGRHGPRDPPSPPRGRPPHRPAHR